MSPTPHFFSQNHIRMRVVIQLSFAQNLMYGSFTRFITLRGKNDTRERDKVDDVFARK